MPNHHPPQPVPYELTVGQILPGHDTYKNKRLLGRGGMGSVYQMVRGELEFQVAVKIMHRDLAARPEFVRMFLEEARILKQVGDHPNLVRILDYAKLSDSTPFIVMELLDGSSLGKVMRADPGKPFDRDVAFRIVKEVLDGVFELHSQGIIHRDLKPDNIYLQKRQTAGSGSAVKILDCGLAFKEERPHEKTLQGTPRYMAPEQIRCDPVSPQTDIYAAALILCEMLIGRLPFDLKRNSARDLMDAHLWMAPTPLSQLIPWLSPNADALILSALHKDPTKRPRSAFEFQSQLFLEAKRLRDGLPPDVGDDANVTTPDAMNFTEDGLPARPVERTEPIPAPRAPRKDTLRMEIAPTHPAMQPDAWQGPAAAPQPWSPVSAAAVSVSPSPAPVLRTPDPRFGPLHQITGYAAMPSQAAVSREPPAASFAAQPSHIGARPSAWPPPSVASTSDTGTTRSVPFEPVQEDPSAEMRRELRRKVLLRWTVLAAGLAFAAFVVVATVSLTVHPPRSPAASSDSSGSAAHSAATAQTSAALPVSAPMPSLAAGTASTGAAVPVGPSAPIATSVPSVAAVPRPVATPSLATPMPRAASGPRSTTPRPKPTASDGSDELFRPWPAN